MKLDRVIAVRNNKTVYRDGDRCVKVFSKAYSKADVLNEALNQARIEETGLCVPKILEVTVVESKWAIVSAYIKGKTLAQLMDENPEKKAAYMDLFVDLQLAVHAKTAPLLNDLKDKMKQKILRSGLDKATCSDLCAHLAGMPADNRVCHGDFNPSNIILTDDGAPYILDWSHTTQGNASADAACTYLLFRLVGDDSGAETYLNAFCKKSNTEKQAVRRWMPIVAASQLVNGNEKEREFLMSWTRVADFEQGDKNDENYSMHR